jgi:prophage antirepressor-like protein
MNEIQVFKNELFGEIRTLTGERGEPLFVGKDVATALGYSNTRKALLDHVDYEDKRDGVTIRDSIGRDQKAVVINESGLYSLILSSKLPQAKAFKRWVTAEVLPQIRRMIRMWIHRKYVLQITDNSFKKAKLNSSLT